MYSQEIMYSQYDDFVVYVSSKAGYDPCKTVFLCPPSKYAGNAENAKKFLEISGWRELIEETEAAAVVLIAADGWNEVSADRVFEIYHEIKNSTVSKSGKAIWGRGGRLWLWETIIYIAGYESGAEYAGNVLVSHPNMFAAAALVNGVPSDYSAGNAPSDHWMVAKVSEDYHVKNNEIPVNLHMFGSNEIEMQIAADYFSQALHSENFIEQAGCRIGEFSAEDPNLNTCIMKDVFCHAVRWKNGPDGTLAPLMTREEFLMDPHYKHHEVTVDGEEYSYSIRIPLGLSQADMKDLPLVLSVHGRGEPAWMFMEKNGWGKLQDETKGFLLVSPDCPGNEWFIKRDHQFFVQMLDEIEEKYQPDMTRVYLTGFSNGAVTTRELTYMYPEKFAAVSPSNGPWFDTSSMELVDASKAPEEIQPFTKNIISGFKEKGCKVPCLFFYGDSDPAAKAEENLALDYFLEVNGCSHDPVTILDQSNYFAKEKGYSEGDRFHAAMYGEDHSVGVVIMKNMPHGAIEEEARFSWEFLKQWKR